MEKPKATTSRGLYGRMADPTYRKRLVNLLAFRPAHKYAAIASALGVSVDSIKKHVAQLKREGQL